MAFVLSVPPYNPVAGKQTSNWKKLDDLSREIQGKLDTFCLCEMGWDKDKSTLTCKPDTKCQGEDCIFWVIT